MTFMYERHFSVIEKDEALAFAKQLNSLEFVRRKTRGVHHEFRRTDTLGWGCSRDNGVYTFYLYDGPDVVTLYNERGYCCGYKHRERKRLGICVRIVAYKDFDWTEKWNLINILHLKEA